MTCKGGIFIFIRENLLFLKKKYNIKWEVLAIETNIPYRTLQDIIYGVIANTRISNVIALAKYFNLTLDEFVLTKLDK